MALYSAINSSKLYIIALSLGWLIGVSIIRVDIECQVGADAYPDISDAALHKINETLGEFSHGANFAINLFYDKY